MTESRGDPIPDENLESWKSNDPEWTWIDRCRSPRIDFHPPTISLPHRFPSNASVPPSTRRRSPPRLRTLRDRPIRIIYSRVNHNRHGRAIGRLRNDKHQQEYRPRFPFSLLLLLLLFPFSFLVRLSNSSFSIYSSYYLRLPDHHGRANRSAQKTRLLNVWGEREREEDEG